MLSICGVASLSQPPLSCSQTDYLQVGASYIFSPKDATCSLFIIEVVEKPFAMPSVIVSNVGSSVLSKQVEELFSFCGKIVSVNQLGPGSFEVQFQLSKAVDTALLLHNAELKDSVISVTTDTPPVYSDYSDNEQQLADNKQQLGDLDNRDQNVNKDINQEEKPKVAVLAQLLASGYKLSDSLIAKAIDFDKERGISKSFLSFLDNLDAEYIHSKDPESAASKSYAQANVVYSDLTRKLDDFANLRDVQNYLDKAAASKGGLKIHHFYKNVAREIKEVHQEANRLYSLQKSQNQTNQKESDAIFDPDTKVNMDSSSTS